MMRIVTGVAVVLMLSGSFSPTRAEETAIKAEDAIVQVLSAYAAAWNSGDAHTIADLYTIEADDAIVGEVVRGRTHVEQRYTDLFSGSSRGSQMTMSMSSLRFLSPAAAIVDGSFEVTGLSANGTPLKRLFVATIVNDSEQWRITAFWSAPRTSGDSTR